MLPVSGGGVLCIVVVELSVGEVCVVFVVSGGFVGVDEVIVVVLFLGGLVGGITEVNNNYKKGRTETMWTAMGGGG